MKEVTWKIEVITTRHKTSLESFLKNHEYDYTFSGNTLQLYIKHPVDGAYIVGEIKCTMEERRALARADLNEVAAWVLNNQDLLEIYDN